MGKELKKHMARLFAYDLAMNYQLLQLAERATNQKRITELFAHLASSQRIWLRRCQKQALNEVVVWPDWDLSQSKSILQSNHTQWIDFIELLGEQELDTMIYYKNSRGEKHQNLLSDIMVHVINHGTHHRAQAGMLLKENQNLTLPYTDYIYFAEQQNNSSGQ